MAHFFDANSFVPVKASLFTTPASFLFTAPDLEDDITGFPIGAFVSFTLKHHIVAFGHAG
jgi:hypothetical protein